MTAVVVSMQSTVYIITRILCRAVVSNPWMEPRLQPAFEAHDEQSPAECKTSDRNSDIEEHHYI